MRPSDISEIKRLYKTDPERCNIDRISGCYVDADKNLVTHFSSGFLILPEEEQFKYLELFRKVLSGTRDKNLLLLEPRTVHRDDHSGDMRGDEVKLLQELVQTGLKDDEVNDRFYRKVIENYSYVDNFLILLAHQNYDIPGKTNDELDLEDASEEVYSHILCAICPVKSTKPGLGYVADDRAFHNLPLGRVVDLPMNGFLYPAFIQRSADYDYVLYFTKDTVDIRPQFADGVLGSNTPLGASDQKDVFSELLTEALGEEGDLSTILGIHEGLKTLVDEKKTEQESPVIDKEKLGELLRSNGLEENRIKAMEERFDTAFRRSPNESAAESATTEEVTSEEQENTALRRYPEEVPIEERIFVASNLVPSKSIEVKNQDFTIKINTNRTELLETKVVDGRKCLLIRLEDGVSVNGIPIQM